MGSLLLSDSFFDPIVVRVEGLRELIWDLRLDLKEESLALLKESRV